MYIRPVKLTVYLLLYLAYQFKASSTNVGNKIGRYVTNNKKQLNNTNRAEYALSSLRR